MILPTKHLLLRESYFGLGAVIIKILIKPKTVDEIWKELEIENKKFETFTSFDDFILTLDYLFIIGIINIDIDNNKIKICN